MVNLNVQSYQASNVPENLRHEIIFIPSQSAFTFGSYGYIDFKEKNVKIRSLYLAVNTGPVSGLTGTETNFPNLNPIDSWFDKIDLTQGGNVQDVVDPDLNRIQKQFYYKDEQRLLSKTASGRYDSASQRNALSTTTSTWYLDLKTYFDQAHILLITTSHEIQLKVFCVH
jgi:hypothetical protein